MTIRRVSDADLSAVVGVHMQSFQNFFLTFLGERFLFLLYHEIARQPGSVFLLSSDDGNSVNGFVAGVTDIRDFLARLARKKWLSFALASVRSAMVRPSIIPRLWRALRAPEKASKASCPACLMSIAVHPAAKRGGIGKELVHAFIGQMAQQGVARVCLTTDRDNNEATNNFYRKLGFTKTQEYKTAEGRWMCEYLIETRIDRAGSLTKSDD